MAKKCTSKKTKSSTAKPKYTCEVCGLVVSVDETCGCAKTCDIICCGQQMKPKK